MSKDVATYWNRSRKKKRRSSASGSEGTPRWFVFAVVVSIGFMLCLAVNLRAISEMNEGAVQNADLNTAVEKLSDENLALQEEIHHLKNDSKAIEREARKIGMSRPNEKILVPTN